MNVTFYNSNAYLIDSKELKEKVFIECEALFGFPLKRDNFPGAHPVTIERKNLPIKERYMICEKTDGERAVLLLLHINNKPMCFMINRKNDLYFMDFSFKKEVFEGSVFDGEIIQTKQGSWNLLLHDCIAYNGTSFMNMNHRLRYACIIDFIIKRYNPRETDCLNIKTKIFYQYGNEVARTWEHIKKTTENKIDGLILTPIERPVIFGRDGFLLKWKQDHTIDFLVKLVAKHINLYYYKKTLTIYKSFKQDSDNYKHIIQSVKNDDSIDLLKGVIIEFKINKDSFEVYKVRTDKVRPNGEVTVMNTFKNIEESIKIEELNLI